MWLVSRFTLTVNDKQLGSFEQREIRIVSITKVCFVLGLVSVPRTVREAIIRNQQRCELKISTPREKY